MATLVLGADAKLAKRTHQPAERNSRQRRSGFRANKCLVSMDPQTEALLTEARPQLWRAFLGGLGVHRAEEALSESMTWAWENRARLDEMDNPVGYLYRVGVTRSTPRPAPSVLPSPDDIGLPDFEPGLIPALQALTEKQRTAVWLIHACGWTYPDAARAMNIGESTVGTHATRGLAALQDQLTKERS